MITPAFPDCVLPDDCACRMRGYPNQNVPHAHCLVPAINATAISLGWTPPYDYSPLKTTSATMEFKQGDSAVLNYKGKLYDVEIMLASANCVSLLVGFDGMIAEHGSVMPLLRHRDGRYYSVASGAGVDLTK